MNTGGKNFCMEKSQEVRLSFEEGSEGGIEYVTPLEKNLYRLDATPMFVDVEVSFGDIIEAEVQANGVLRFRRVAMRSPWRHWSWVLSKDTVESAPFRPFSKPLRHMAAFGSVFSVESSSLTFLQILTSTLKLHWIR